MKTRSKRYKEEEKGREKGKTYSIEEAVEITKKSSKTKFDASVEVHFHLGINPKKADQIVRGSIVLPHGTGKTKKIAAFVTPKEEAEAKEAGVDVIGNDTLIEEIKANQICDFDIAIAVPQVMKKLGPIARILGQKGLMPNPKTETITTNIAKTVEQIKKGKVSFRSDDAANLHQIAGKVSFDNKKLEENIEAVLTAIKRAKPETLKGTYIKSATICSSMGPSIAIEI